jgi:hypothetical protein
MAYSINPNLPRAKAFAMKILIVEKRPMVVVTNRRGLHRPTIWRSKQKWDVLNENVQFTNSGRPTVRPGQVFRFNGCRRVISTTISRPFTNPHAVDERIVARILELRAQLKR